MAVLDNLSGFEFEDLIEDVFRNLSHENVHQAARTADGGRDVLMENVVDRTRRTFVVKCKHTRTVGRPVVQELHSAVTMFDFDGPRRGMVVTTFAVRSTSQKGTWNFFLKSATVSESTVSSVHYRGWMI